VSRHDDEEDELEYVSKSELKREMHRRQSLGEELIKLNNDQLNQFDLPDALVDAIHLAKTIHQRGAIKRQLQYIGRLMRDLDPGPIQEKLETLKGHSKQAHAQLHAIERWRDRLLAEGDHALEQLIEEHPETDRQRVRQLLRSAHKEHKENKPPKSFRALFKYLRDIISQADDNSE